jgi:hypothetical protein
MNLSKIVFIFTIFLTAHAFATEVCLKVNNNVQYKSAFANYDGSITVIEPKLSVSGEPMLLHYDFSNDYSATAAYCKLMGKELVQFGSRLNPKVKNAVKLDAQGFVSEVVPMKSNKSDHVISRIICR